MIRIDRNMGNNCPGPRKQMEGWSLETKQCLISTKGEEDYNKCLGEINKKLKKNIDNTALKTEQARVAAVAQRRQNRAQREQEQHARDQAHTSNTTEEPSYGGYRSKGKRRSSRKSTRRSKKRCGTKRQVR